MNYAIRTQILVLCLLVSATSLAKDTHCSLENQLALEAEVVTLFDATGRSGGRNPIVRPPPLKDLGPHTHTSHTIAKSDTEIFSAYMWGTNNELGIKSNGMKYRVPISNVASTKEELDLARKSFQENVEDTMFKTSITRESADVDHVRSMKYVNASSKLLAKQGVAHEIVAEGNRLYIIISTEGSHSMNRFARIQSRNHTQVIFDPIELANKKVLAQLASYGPANRGYHQEIYIDAWSIRNGDPHSLYNLHEATHARRIAEDIESIYDINIYTAKANDGSLPLTGLHGYDDTITFDEMAAFGRQFRKGQKLLESEIASMKKGKPGNSSKINSAYDTTNNYRQYAGVVAARAKTFSKETLETLGINSKSTNAQLTEAYSKQLGKNLTFETIDGHAVANVTINGANGIYHARIPLWTLKLYATPAQKMKLIVDKLSALSAESDLVHSQINSQKIKANALRKELENLGFEFQ